MENNERPSDEHLIKNIKKWTSLILQAQKEQKKINVFFRNGESQLMEPSFLLGFNHREGEIVSPIIIDIEYAGTSNILSLSLANAENIEVSEKEISFSKMTRWDLWSDKEILDRMKCLNSYMIGRIKY